MSPFMTAHLTLQDIADTRAYERERDEFRAHIIELKRRRRIFLGTVISLVFECRDTVRFQVQEMARVERITTDAGIQAELDVYNRLLPGDGELSATLFIECTTADQMREWFPKLVGIESAIELRIGDRAAPLVVACYPEADHASRLTREEITSAVHYVRFPVGAANAAALAAGPVVLAVTHPAYLEEVELGDASRAELAADLAS